MYTATNKFGSATMYEEQDIQSIDKKILIFNSACLTIQTETLGWANEYRQCITTDPTEADIIVLLGCQVTDLAILNDIKSLLALKEKYTDAEYYVGGCLGQRIDIELPSWAKRIDLLYKDLARIDDDSLVIWQEPFWKSEKDAATFLRTDNNTKYHYLRMGKGCHGKCKYCTIRTTRKDFYELPTLDLTAQIMPLMNSYIDVVVPVADTLSSKQIEWAYKVATQYNIQFALRNIEPATVLKSYNTLAAFARTGLLHTVHMPIQSLNPKILLSMGRDPVATASVINLSELLHAHGIVIATNLIIDYNGMEEYYKSVYDLFDHVAWNPYWDGQWDMDNAELRMKKYLPDYKVNII